MQPVASRRPARALTIPSTSHPASPRAAITKSEPPKKRKIAAPSIGLTKVRPVPIASTRTRTAMLTIQVRAVPEKPRSAGVSSYARDTPA